MAVAEGNEGKLVEPGRAEPGEKHAAWRHADLLFGMAIPYQWLSAALPVDKYAVGLKLYRP